MSLHSVWGCVVGMTTGDTAPIPPVERPFRITSASLQARHDYGSAQYQVAIFLARPHGGDLQIALLGPDYCRVVDLDLTFREGEVVAFYRRSLPQHHTPPTAQLVGYYLDDCAMCTGPKHAPPLSIERGDGATVIDGELEIHIKKRPTENEERLRMEKKRLEEELRMKNTTIEKLYSQVEELTIDLKQLQGLNG